MAQKLLAHRKLARPNKTGRFTSAKLGDARRMPQIFRESRDGYPPTRFELNTIYTF